MAKLSLNRGDISGFPHQVFSHGMPDRMRCFSFHTGVITNLLTPETAIITVAPRTISSSWKGFGMTAMIAGTAFGARM